jgi:hypothetical protein
MIVCIIPGQEVTLFHWPKIKGGRLEGVEALRARLAPYRSAAREIAASLPPLTEEQLQVISEAIHGVHLTAPPLPSPDTSEGKAA